MERRGWLAAMLGGLLGAGAAHEMLSGPDQADREPTELAAKREHALVAKHDQPDVKRARAAAIAVASALSGEHVQESNPVQSFSDMSFDLSEMAAVPAASENKLQRTTQMQLHAAGGKIREFYDAMVGEMDVERDDDFVRMTVRDAGYYDRYEPTETEGFELWFQIEHSDDGAWKLISGDSHRSDPRIVLTSTNPDGFDSAALAGAVRDEFQSSLAQEGMRRTYVVDEANYREAGIK